MRNDLTVCGRTPTPAIGLVSLEGPAARPTELRPCDFRRAEARQPAEAIELSEQKGEVGGAAAAFAL
jgi:hypothetical protein